MLRLSAALALLALLAGQSAAQPFVFTPRSFAPERSEPGKRLQIDYTGLTFDFNTASSGADTTPNGNLKGNQITQNPFMSTLPGDGNGQTLVTMGPCAGNTPHVHPRGSEISFMLYGEVNFGMIEENGAQERLVLRRIKQNTTISIPQGLLHFSHNDNCAPAAFLANFGTVDPGTQTAWQALFTVPTPILNMASGVPEAMIEEIKTKYPFIISPGTGGEDCLKRCGLTFEGSNAFVPKPALPPPSPAYGGGRRSARLY